MVGWGYVDFQVITEYFKKDNPSNKILPSLEQILKVFGISFTSELDFKFFCIPFNLFTLLSSSMAKVFIVINFFVNSDIKYYVQLSIETAFVGSFIFSCFLSLYK